MDDIRWGNAIGCGTGTPNGVAPQYTGATLAMVPTTRPRYTFTDTGELRELLDAAQRRWPEVTERKRLLIRLAEEGHAALELVESGLDAEERHERLRRALRRIPSLVDADRLLCDEAWR